MESSRTSKEMSFIEQAIKKVEKSRLSKEFDINERSVLLDLAYINIPMNFNQYTCNLISYLINEKIFTYAELNRKLAEYQYSYLDKANKPQELTKINVEKWSLKQTAITVFLFAYILPHIISEKN